MSYNAFIYCRTATWSQDERRLPRAVKKQDKPCRAYAAAHGIKVIETVTDFGVSGRSAQNAGFEAMLELLQNVKEPRAVIVAARDRLSRDESLAASMEAKLAEIDTTLIVLSEVCEQAA